MCNRLTFDEVDWMSTGNKMATGQFKMSGVDLKQNESRYLPLTESVMKVNAMAHIWPEFGENELLFKGLRIEQLVRACNGECL